jgi:phage tail tube protein FII
MTGSNLWSDGNALAGHVQDVFRVDISTAVGRCTACGRTGPIAEARGFDHAPGVAGRAWLDLRGLAYLQLPVPDQT